MNKMVDLLGQIVGIQNRLLSNTTSQLNPSYLPNAQRCFHHLLLNCALLRLCNNIFPRNDYHYIYSLYTKKYILQIF